MKFNYSERVKIIGNGSFFFGITGRCVDVEWNKFNHENWYMVEWWDDVAGKHRSSKFTEDELEAIQ